MRSFIILRLILFFTTGILFIGFHDFVDLTLTNSIIYTVVIIVFIITIDIFTNAFDYYYNYKIISTFIFGIIFLGLGTIVLPYFEGYGMSIGTEIAFFIVVVYLGMSLGYRYHRFTKNLIIKLTGIRKVRSRSVKIASSRVIIDTSVLIDGRIADIILTNVMEGSLIIPDFVLKELQIIADSSEHLRRQKGRRGLNTLKLLQDGKVAKVEILKTTLDKAIPVDERLILLAKELRAKLITTDFNLLKIAEIQNVKSININNLSRALRQSILPGEILDITVVKEGKDYNQGVGYIDDGTMVVVDNGYHLKGKQVEVEVYSLLQNESGRMIFAKIVKRKNNGEK